MEDEDEEDKECVPLFFSSVQAPFKDVPVDEEEKKGPVQVSWYDILFPAFVFFNVARGRYGGKGFCWGKARAKGRLDVPCVSATKRCRVWPDYSLKSAPVTVLQSSVPKRVHGNHKDRPKLDGRTRFV